MKLHSILFCSLLLISISAFSQTATISGNIMDGKDNFPLFMANVIVRSQKDTAKFKFATSDEAGNFKIANVEYGTYFLESDYFGYSPIKKSITVDKPTLEVGEIKLFPVASELTEIVLKTKRPPTVQKGDTTEINAGSYKVNPNANAEDLVTKMPGISIQNGAVKAQGEDVKQVLIDGKPYFGEDANMALKNLPADVISKIQIFEKASDQAAFTGFDDGSSAKTLNIVTKPEFRNGKYGNVTAGYGTNDRYLASGNMNIANNDQRLSIIGLSNNINQQNFSSQDLIGLTGTSNQGGPRPPGGGGGGSYRGGSGGPSQRPDNGNNFLIGQQNGISRVSSLGLNYTDSLGKKIALTGSYFFNQTRNENFQNLDRQYFVNENSSQFYTEKNNSNSQNYNHRANLRIEYQIDSANSLIFTPKFSYQGNENLKLFNGLNTLNSLPLNQSLSKTNANSSAYNLATSVLYRHKFKKAGRTFSYNLDLESNERNGDVRLNSNNLYYSATMVEEDTLNQLSNSFSNSKSIGNRLTYTEPISKTQMLQFNYFNQYSTNKSRKLTEELINEQLFSDSSLSGRLNNQTLTNRAGLSYKLKYKKLNFSAGSDLQHSRLEGVQTLPLYYNIDRSFFNVLPNAMMMFKGERKNFRLYYRTTANLPSVNQLQNAIDNSNPLILTSGNPGLRQDFGQNLIGRYSHTSSKSNAFFAFFRVAKTSNYIGNSTSIASSDSLLKEGVILKKGSQLNSPVNLNGFYNIGTFATYSFSVDSIKSKVNLNLGYNYLRTPGLINQQLNYSNSNGISAGLGLVSNISEKIDYNISTTSNYTFVKNTVRPELNSNYFIQNSSLKVNLIFKHDITFQNETSHYFYRGLSSGFNQNFILFNVSVGKRVFKNKNGEIKVTVFDLFKQNKNISRTTTETYIEDSQSLALTRYFMLTFSYKIRSFKSAK